MTKKLDDGQSMVAQKVVVIGGGTGSFTILSGLKAYTPNITALVNMVDDGGSTGVLRDELGVLPPGDVRQCLVALSSSPIIRDLFDYRFSEGSLAGHSFGNLFLTALEKTTGSFATAVETSSKILNIHGRVVPITLDDVRLDLQYANGKFIHGEHDIDVANFEKDGMRPELLLTPNAQINPEAKQAIIDANVIVIAPGDIYTSIGPALIVEGMSEALISTKATIVYVCNLVVKPGQTMGMSVADHASEVERFMGGKGLDFVLYNNAKPVDELKKRYADDGEFLVQVNEKEFEGKNYRALGESLIATDLVEKRAGDRLSATRSYIRHDPSMVVQLITELPYLK